MISQSKPEAFKIAMDNTGIEYGKDNANNYQSESTKDNNDLFPFGWVRTPKQVKYDLFLYNTWVKLYEMRELGNKERAR